MKKIQRHSLIILQKIMTFMKTEDYNLKKKRKVLIVFDDMVADMEANKKLGTIVTELLNRKNLIIRRLLGRKSKQLITNLSKAKFSKI